MASFQAKTGWKRMRKRENKNYHYVSFLPEAQQKTPTKQQKNSKNLKIPTMASFQAKIGWKMPGKGEYEKYHSVSFLPDAKQKISKKEQKNSKN